MKQFLNLLHIIHSHSPINYPNVDFTQLFQVLHNEFDESEGAARAIEICIQIDVYVYPCNIEQDRD